LQQIAKLASTDEVLDARSRDIK